MNITHTTPNSWRTRDALRDRTRLAPFWGRLHQSVAGITLGVPAALGSMFLVASLGISRLAMPIGPALLTYVAVIGLPAAVALLLVIVSGPIYFG